MTLRCNMPTSVYLMWRGPVDSLCAAYGVIAASLALRTLQVDVYSFSMILYQLFEHQPPFAGTDPVEAARQAALYEHRPPLSQLKGRLEPFPVGASGLPAFRLE